MEELGNIDSVDDNPPICQLDNFKEFDEVMEMIVKLQHDDFTHFEKAYENFSEILGRYQEQPHLLDPHLSSLIEKLLIFIKDDKSSDSLRHASFKYLYQLSKVRTFKVFLKYLPHEIGDIDFVITYLEVESLEPDSVNWESKYIMLLWLSIMILNPFHMSRLDAFNSSPNDTDPHPIKKSERIYKICQTYTAKNDTCAMVAAFLAAKFLTRIDVADTFLPEYIDWVRNYYQGDVKTITLGQLVAVSLILKNGKRDDLLRHTGDLMSFVLGNKNQYSSDFLKSKYFIKIIQRIGMVYLKPRLALWRYNRGSRSLISNLNTKKNDEIVEFENKIFNENDGDGDDQITIPDEIEEVIDELLQALRSPSSEIRWSAAKGIGRITNRLPKVLGDEVVGSVIEIINPLEPHEAWHGACLAVAELAKRGLLLPYRLTALVPLLLQALVYDEMKGYMSVGKHIRDAACYMCWAFARAYAPSDLEPFVNEISSGLIVTIVFDREVNCRRAASAAFQESVGRLGNFPHGIDILTTADFYSVGLRTNSYLKISNFIAQYNEYTTALIQHLITKKINHWDKVIRELSAKALYNLAQKVPEYMVNEVLPVLLRNCDSIDINMRHGSVLSIGEIIYSLYVIGEVNNVTYLGSDLIDLIGELIIKFHNRDQFRGMSGELMYECCCEMIRNCSEAHFLANEKSVEYWQLTIDQCIVKKSDPIRILAVKALSSFCLTYYSSNEKAQHSAQLVHRYLVGCENDLEEFVRMGYVSALGALPLVVLKSNVQNVTKTLIKLSLIPKINKTDMGEKVNPQLLRWSESRRDSVRSLSKIITSVGFSATDPESFINNGLLDDVFTCFLIALDEYTIDDRGDIGAWVREAAMNALYDLIMLTPSNLLKPDTIHSIMTGLAQQAVEKIDRTRGLAAKLFCKIIFAEPEIVHIKQHNQIRLIFPNDYSNILWLHADHTFPLFCSLLSFPEYSKKMILGLVASIGQLTESLIKYSSTAFMQYLREHPNNFTRIANDIIAVFKDNQQNNRITQPMLNFLDILLGSRTMNMILLDENSIFADEIYRLVKLEIKGHKKLYKLTASINVFCHLIQVPRLCKKVLSTLSIFLGLPYVHVRKITASKLYEAMLLNGDTCGVSDDSLMEIQNMLLETDWGQPLPEIRPIRNELCALLNISPPVALPIGV